MEVPYKTNELAVADILTGEIGMNFVALASATALIKAGKLRPLGMTSADRFVTLPDIPAVQEHSTAPNSKTDPTASGAPQLAPSDRFD
jgi:tripartite-type tricarboxylate transporter receptor subunit TctC